MARVDGQLSHEELAILAAWITKSEANLRSFVGWHMLEAELRQSLSERVAGPDSAV